MTINCHVIINGISANFPLELRIEDDKYFVVIGRDVNKNDIILEIDAALVDKPHGGLATWTYKGQIYVDPNHK